MKKSEKNHSTRGESREVGVEAHPRQSPSAHREQVPHEVQVRARAYEIYLERGDRPGDDLSDWLQAERECDRGV